MRKSYRPSTTRYSVRLEDTKIEMLKEIYGDLGITELLKCLIDERLEGEFDKNRKLRSPIIRVGGKSRLAEEIVGMFPAHKIYVDVFGGEGHILIEKDARTSVKEIFNDKYDEIFNLFKVIQNRPLDLKNRLLEMKYSRKYYEELKKTRATYTDAVDKAAIFVYLVRYSFNGDTKAGYRITKIQNVQKLIENIANDLEAISNRFKGVQLECKDYKYILQKYDSEDTLFFVDPPYLIENKESGLYEHKFNRKDMWELIKMLKKIKGKFILTHYENRFLDSCFENWTNKVEIETVKWSGATGSEKKPRVIECVWCNFDIDA